MAFDFNVISRKFFTKYRNGPTFVLNPIEFTDFLRGNVGDLVRYDETVEVTITFNPDESLTATYDSTGADGLIEAPGINFVNEGFLIGWSIDICQGADVWSSTIENITGPGFNKMYVDKTLITGLADGPHTDIVIKLKTAPQRAQYKYGLIRSDVGSVSDSNYNSPLDGNTQGYYKISLTGGLTDMIPLNDPFKSWDLAESVQARFVGTVDTYKHQYQIVNTFRIPFYVEGQLGNIATLVPPEDLISDLTYKYTSELRLGGNSGLPGKFSQIGFVGDVGYFNENYNGKANIFSFTAFSITNSDATGTIEATLTNNVSGTINASVPAFNAPQQIIVSIAKLTAAVDYENKEETFDDVFLFDSLAQDTGAAPVGSTIITNLTATYTDTQNIDFDFNVDYTALQQAQINAGDNWLIFIQVGDETLAVDLENNVNLRTFGTFSKNTNLAGLITNHDPLYFDGFAAYSGPRQYTNVAGWDGDLIGILENFDLNQPGGGENNKITNILSQLILVNGDDVRILFSRILPTVPTLETFSGGYTYQIIDIAFSETFKLPELDEYNRIEIQSVPAFPAGFQPWVIQTALPRITWRDWIPNSDIPDEFFDAAEPNNNLNNKASNYSGVGGWDIYHRFLVTVEQQQIVINDDFPPKSEIQIVNTLYDLRSDAFEILDFDDDGGTGFTATWELTDLIGEVVIVMFSNTEVLIEVSFDHSLGILSTQDLWGMIWIMPDEGTDLWPWALHTHRNWTHPDNPLTPSDTLTTGNVSVVEVVSTLNNVKLYCQTNPDNLDEGIGQNVYARLGKINIQ